MPSVCPGSLPFRLSDHSTSLHGTPQPRGGGLAVTGQWPALGPHAEAVGQHADRQGPVSCGYSTPVSCLSPISQLAFLGSPVVLLAPSLEWKGAECPVSLVLSVPHHQPETHSLLLTRRAYACPLGSPVFPADIFLKVRNW